MTSRALFILCLLLWNSLIGQEKFSRFDGHELLADTSLRTKYGIKEIHRTTTYKYHPSEHEYYYLNEQGLIDSINRWASDDDDTLLRLSKEVYQYQNNLLTERSFIQYHNIFSSGSDGDQWLPCYHETYYSYNRQTVDPLSMKMPSVDRLTIVNSDIDSSEISVTNVNVYHLNDTMIRAYVHRKNGIGTESFLLEHHSYNQNDQLVKKVEEVCVNGNCSHKSTTVWKYNDSGQLISKTYASNDAPEGLLVRSWSYDKKGRLIFEKVTQENLGIESRAYSYDSNDQLVKVKEKHFSGFVVRYKISYDSRGLLSEIAAKHRYGYEIQHFSYSYR